MIPPLRIMLVNCTLPFESLNWCFFGVLGGLYPKKTLILEHSATCTKEATGRRG